jgi:hypothetical protein
MGADEADLGGGFLLLDGLGDLAIVFQRRGGGVDDDVIELARLFQALLDADVVRRAIEQLAVGHQRGRLGQPGGIPKRGDFAPRLVTRAGAAVKPVKAGR